MRKSVDQTSTRSLRSHARSNTMTFRRSSTGSDSYASVVRRSSSTGNSPSLSSPPVSSGNGRGRSVRTLLSSLNSSLEPSRSPTTIEFDDDDEEKEVFPSPSSTSHEFPDELLEGSDDRSRGRGRPNRDIYMDEEKTQMYGDGDVRQIEEEKSQRVDQTTRLCEGCFEDHCLDLADFKKRSQKACQTGNFVRGGNFFDGSCLEMNQFGLPDAIIKGFYYRQCRF
ncbi:hypothetical protein BY996DRAFT_4425284 [Phakopsora pachyrhizi]|nr:hypothetical protein BY996DRAFT_4425284 [Phakopsora pachyrhizi]